MFSRRWITGGLALLVGGGLAAAIPGLAAVGESSPPGSPDILVSPAQIVDKGAAALVRVQVLCQPDDWSHTLTVSLNEKSGNGIASGTSPMEAVPCTGQTEVVTVPITPTPKPFTRGTAYGQLSFQDCGFSGCVTSTDARSVTLTTK
jgi:hypothetical protein